MSIMQCSKCEKMVDTDFEGFAFGQDLCESCWVEAGYLDSAITKLETELDSMLKKDKK